MARDFEWYGTVVPVGSAMLLLFGPANRDSRRHHDPDTFNIHRDNIAHLTFGKGLHYCLGANLTRLEGGVALDELLNCWPEWASTTRPRSLRRHQPFGAESGCASIALRGR
jgi:cytochrome P450